jgi:hypothetical protein
MAMGCFWQRIVDLARVAPGCRHAAQKGFFPAPLSPALWADPVGIVAAF